MALVQTDVLSDVSVHYDTVQMLRMALADELAATNLYDRLLQHLQKSGSTMRIKRTIDQITEIMRDELNHTGRLESMVREWLPEPESRALVAGLDFKEAPNA